MPMTPRPAPSVRPLTTAQRGFTLIELLVSVTLTMVVVLAMDSALLQYRRLHRDQTERSAVRLDLHSGFEFLTRDLENAGFRLVGQGLEGFGVLFPSADASEAVGSDALTIWSRPDPIEARVALAMGAASDPIPVDSVAGFSAGETLWLLGTCSDGVARRSRFVVGSIDAVAPLRLHHPDPLGCAYEAGARVVRIRETSYRFAPGADGTGRLVRSVDGGAPAILAERVTALTFAYFDGASPAATLVPDEAAERRAIRRIRVTLEGRRSHAAPTAPPIRLTGEVSPRNLEEKL